MSDISKRFWLSCAAIGALNASLLGSAHAQDGDKRDAIQLKPIVVEGQEKGINAPTVLTERETARDLQERQVDRIDDIGRLDPGINYNQTSDSINIRGLGKDRVLSTVDGIRIPWLDDGARGVQGGISTIDFDTLSTLDIIRGADSSLFGSGALGGVISLRTLNPEDLLTEGRNWGSLTKGSYDSADRSWNINQAFAARANDTYILLQGGYRAGHERENMGDIGGYGVTRTEKNPAEYDQNNLLFKIHQHVDGGHRFGFTAEQFDLDRDIHKLDASSFPMDGPRATYVPGTFWETETRKRERLSVNYDYDGSGDAWLDQASVILYWQRLTEGDDSRAIRRTYPVGNYRRDNTLEETDVGINAIGLKAIELGAYTHTFKFGVDGYLSTVKQQALGEDNCNGPNDPRCAFLHTNQAEMPEVDGGTLGLFVEDQIALYDGRLRVTPGLRFDWYERNPQETPLYEENPSFRGYPADSSDSRFSPKLRAEWDAAENVVLYAQWAQAFRAPSSTELYMTYGGPGTYLNIGNPDLKPETSNGFDIGAKFGDDQFGGSLSVYNNYYRNFIDNVSVSAAEAGVPPGMFPMGITRYVNRAHVQIYGAEAKAHYAFSNGWKTWGGIAFAVGKDTDEDVYLNSIPALKGVVGLGYATETWGTDFMMTAVAARNKVENPDSDYNKTPGYTLFDVTGWWEPEQFKGLRIQAGIYNIFDKKYWNALDIPDSGSVPKDYYTEPGRTFKISMTQRF
ncbi:TonB-dependent hemoglobin/transferrin/lactoferrin family receptor [Phyllobacterium phragmitis]|uniref:TonB-dependent hemoglobin/transferrin/lactoferrin family receptor n=1 Tax=Phyllobacterium phragmitis TaxID=2670329 RepID=A0ABQ0GZQ5_9HYPH